MNEAEVEEILKKIILKYGDEIGWVHLSEVGTQLRKAGIQYGKLSIFLEDYADIVETCIDSTVTPPAKYAKLVKSN